MRRVLMIALASAAIGLGTATPAQAVQLIYCGSGSSCLSGTTNVNLITATDVPTGFGNVGIGGPGISFTSTQGNISLDASGQATITSAVSATLSQLTFTMAAGYAFSAAEFDLFNGSGDNVSVTLTTSAGDTKTLLLANTNGTNWFDIIGEGTESFVSASFQSTGGSFDAFRQLRVTLATAAVPEPASWGLMLLGFAGIGMTLRRSRRRSGALMQIA